jgi:hypothetical protein
MYRLLMPRWELTAHVSADKPCRELMEVTAALRYLACFLLLSVAPSCLAQEAKIYSNTANFSAMTEARLPGESREIDIESPVSSVKGGLTLGLRGWTVSEKVVKVG